MAATPSTGTELFTSGGTAATTRLLADLEPGPRSSNPKLLQGVGNLGACIATTTASGTEVWLTNATSVGTRLAGETVSGPGGLVTRLSAVGSELFFSTRDLSLWRNDTKSGRSRLVATNRYLDSEVGGKILVRHGLSLSAFDPATGRETVVLSGALRNVLGKGAAGERYFHEYTPTVLRAWVTDGTAKGTTALSLPEDWKNEGSYPTNFAPLDGKLLWQGVSPGAVRSHIFKSDPASAKTERLTTATSLRFPGSLVEFAGRVWFGARAPGVGIELMTTDGTPRGTGLFADLARGLVSSHPHPWTVVGRRMFFTATDPATGTEPWSTDGSVSGTTGLDLTTGSDGTDVRQITPWGELAILSVRDGKSKRPVLWVSDGTASGSYPIRTGSTVQSIEVGAVRPGLIVYSVRPLLHQPGSVEIWASDGRKNGREFRLLSFGTQSARRFTAARFGSRILFSADSRIWTTLGVPVTTKLFTNGHADAIVPFGDRFVLDYQEPTLGRVLAITDGIQRPTPLLISPRFGAIATHGNRWITFVVDEEIWISDGTPVGTRSLGAKRGRDSRWRRLVGGRIFYPGTDEFHGDELWAIDGVGGVAQPFGEGCGRRDRVIELRSEPPRLGRSVELTVSDGPTASAAALVLGVPRATPLALPNGCRAYVGILQSPFVAPFSLGAVTFRGKAALPADPSLNGLRVAWQVFALTATGLEASRALEWMLGT